MQGFNRLAHMFGEGTPGEQENDGDVDDRGMPLKFSQNRMQQSGISGIAAIGEALVDKIRAAHWNKQNPGAGMGPEMGAMAQGGPGAPPVVQGPQRQRRGWEEPVIEDYQYQPQAPRWIGG